MFVFKGEMKREIEKLGKYKYYIRPAYKQWVQPNRFASGVVGL